MKSCKRLISLLLALVMVFTLAACTKDGTGETTAPPTTEPAATKPAEPSAADIYNEARKALDEATDLAAEQSSKTITTVNGSEFTEQSTQTVVYRDIGKETASILSEEAVTFGDQEDPAVTYTQIWSQGNVYASLNEKYYAQAAMDAEEASEHFVPVVLLDASLYESVTMEQTEQGTLVSFSQSTAPEAWITTEELEYLDAAGSALITASGDIAEMKYQITVDYGMSQIQLEVTSKPLDTVKEITVPTDTAKYVTTDDITALYMYGTAEPKLALAEKLEMEKSELMFSAASGDYIAGTTTFATHGTGEDAIYKITEDIYVMDYSTEEDYQTSYKMNYKNGTITLVEDEGLPTFRSATWEEASEPIWLMIESLAGNLSPDYWESVTTTYFGNLVLLEFEFNENFSNTRQNDICEFLFGDAKALTDLATKYEGKKLTGYLSFDGCTGFPVAIGYNYEGAHTIDGNEYPLLQEVHTSIITPSANAHKFITDKLPESQEPENNATPLFYKVTGDNGQQMWLLGTIHVGDVRTSYLPQEIKDAFAQSDALAVECDTKAFHEKLEDDEELAKEFSKLYYNENNESLETVLEEEDYKTLVQLLKASGSYDANTLYMKPSVVASFLSNVFMDLGYTYTSDYGVEEQLYTWAEEQKKPIREVESVLFQMEMDSHYSKELQNFLLQQTLEDCPGATWQGVNELYELWCAGDESALREYINQEPDTSEMTEEELAEYEAAKPLLEEYNKAMSTDRNEGMLEVAIEYLESGDVVFYAVGLAHLLEGEKALVDTLREAGYTVELVTYGA